MLIDKNETDSLFSYIFGMLKYTLIAATRQLIKLNDNFMISDYIKNFTFIT